jgi:hypothetical protein
MSNTLLPPVSDNAPSLVKLTEYSGLSIKFEPLTIAALHSPFRFADMVTFRAVRLEEEAMSTVQ